MSDRGSQHGTDVALIEVEHIRHQLVLGLFEHAFLGALLEQHFDLFDGDRR